MNARLLTVVAVALAAAIAALPAGAGSSSHPRVKNVKREIESIAMDGHIVAYDLGAKFDPGCNKVYIWNVNTNGGKVVSGEGTCNADGSSTGGGVREIAVAGDRLAWIVNEGGLSESDDYLYTASLSNPKEKKLADAMRTGDIDGRLDGGWIGGLVGDGDLLGVSTWTTSGNEITRGALKTIGAAGLKTIANGSATVEAVSANAGRIAVVRHDGTVAIYSKAGGLLKTVAAQADEAMLDGNRLVVLRVKQLVVYDASSGAVLHTWTIARDAVGLDAEAGIATFTTQCRIVDQCGGRTYVTRLSDGKTVLLARPGHDLVGLAIEPAGLVYAISAGSGKSRLVLYTLKQVQAALG